MFSSINCVNERLPFLNTTYAYTHIHTHTHTHLHTHKHTQHVCTVTHVAKHDNMHCLIMMVQPHVYSLCMCIPFECCCACLCMLATDVIYRTICTHWFFFSLYCCMYLCISILFDNYSDGHVCVELPYN